MRRNSETLDKTSFTWLANEQKKKKNRNSSNHKNKKIKEKQNHKRKKKKSLTIFDGFTLELTRINSNQLGDHGNVRSSRFSKKQKLASKFGLHSTPHLRTHLTKQQMEAIWKRFARCSLCTCSGSKIPVYQCTSCAVFQIATSSEFRSATYHPQAQILLYYLSAACTALWLPVKFGIAIKSQWSLSRLFKIWGLRI